MEEIDNRTFLKPIPYLCFNRLLATLTTFVVVWAAAGLLGADQ